MRRGRLRASRGHELRFWTVWEGAIPNADIAAELPFARRKENLRAEKMIALSHKNI
jgi:hypothetical protein